MSIKTIITCDICDKEFSTSKWINDHVEGGGVGLVFRSGKSDDFTIGGPHDANGKHICNKCALTLFQELTKYFK